MRTRTGWLVYLLAFWVVLVGWAMASPVGSAPDDDYHLASIWCAEGVAENACSDEGVDAQSLAVPAGVADAHLCYAFSPEVSGRCAADVLGSDAWQPTARVNEKAELYPGGFYSAMHLFVGPDVARSVTVMRIVNATLAVAALAWVIGLAGGAARRMVAVATAVVWIPLGLSILGSTNPSSWTFTGLMLLTASALLLLRETWRTRRWWLAAAGAVMGAFMAVSSRLDASMYVGVIVVVVGVLAGIGALRRNWQASVLLVALAAWGALTFLLAPTPGGGPGGTMGQAEQGIGLLLSNISYVGIYIQGVVGGWPLSWNDVNLPPSIPIIGTLALGAVIALGMRVMNPHKAWALGLSVAALIAVPLVFLQREGLGVGEVVQPRYIAPLLLLAVMIAMAGVDAAADADAELPDRESTAGTVTFPAGVRWSLTIGLALSASLSWWVFTHRFAYGSGVGVFDAEAIAPYGVAWVLVSAAGLVWLWWALRTTRASSTPSG